MSDQLVGYWNASNAQFEGPANTPSASVETFVGFQATGASATNFPLGIASRAGLLKDVRVAAITPLTGNDIYTVDIKKNGVSVLVGGTPISLLSSTAARISVVGSLDPTKTAIADGDFLEAAITFTHNTGTGPLNVVFQAQLLQN
ncbi:MAG: hypothetical protein IVW57_11465 [Ktedonobacterales bacterium]|nr:hypothetical protein [Ktedonobacterales bacterium]